MEAAAAEKVGNIFFRSAPHNTSLTYERKWHQQTKRECQGEKEKEEKRVGWLGDFRVGKGSEV